MEDIIPNDSSQNSPLKAINKMGMFKCILMPINIALIIF